jgi:hypothetical protein
MSLAVPKSRLKICAAKDSVLEAAERVLVLVHLGTLDIVVYNNITQIGL